MKKSELSLMWQMKREAERDFHKFIKYVAELEEENKKLKEERDELDRINHNLNAQISDLYDIKQILRDIVINVNRLDKLKEVVFKYDTKPED